jgi:hypothetical protein
MRTGSFHLLLIVSRTTRKVGERIAGRTMRSHCVRFLEHFAVKNSKGIHGLVQGVFPLSHNMRARLADPSVLGKPCRPQSPPPIRTTLITGHDLCPFRTYVQEQYVSETLLTTAEESPSQSLSLCSSRCSLTTESQYMNGPGVFLRSGETDETELLKRVVSGECRLW